MIVSLAFDVNTYLYRCEEIANKHVDTDPLFRFVPWYRYPINGLPMDKRDKIDDVMSSLIKPEPYLPYKCVPLVNKLLRWHIYNTTMVDTLTFKTNLVDKKNGRDYYKLYMMDMDPTEIVRHYLEESSDTDVLIIENEVRNIFEETGMRRYVSQYVDHVFEFNTDNKIFILDVLGHIKSIRYDENLNNRGG